MTSSQKFAACPICNRQLVRILYGLPGPEAFELSQTGKLILGGCAISESNPTVGCPVHYRAEEDDLLMPGVGPEVD